MSDEKLNAVMMEAEWASEADREAYLDSLVSHGKAVSSLREDGKKRFVDLDDMYFDKPSGGPPQYTR